jgi:acyl carrier protein
VVVSAHDSDSGRLLAAYLVAAEPAEGLPAVGELRDYLRDRVPEFMIPSLFTELAALPLTPTGKLDHAALPSPEGAQLRSASGYTEPSTPTEVRLARVWAAILNQDHIGIHDNFFDLGGHSLLAIQMISRIREVCGVDIPIATVFDKPTIVELAVAINKSILGMDDDSGEYEEFEF